MTEDMNREEWSNQDLRMALASPTLKDEVYAMPESGITNDEIEQKWAELNADDGDIRIMAMLHELLQLQRRTEAPPEGKHTMRDEVYAMLNGLHRAGQLNEQTVRILWPLLVELVERRRG